MAELNIILIIGAPGTGKSLLGAELEANSPEKLRFFSVGNRLRELGKLDEPHSHTKLEDLRKDAKDLVESEIHRHMTEPTSISVLALEYVKSIDDAFALMDMLRVRQGVRLMLVLYISGYPEAVEWVCPRLDTRSILLKKAGYSTKVSAERDRDRQVQLRQEKWQNNGGSLIEFFSSTGSMFEVSGEDPVLAKLGYEDTEGRICSINPPTGLLFTPLKPVVSKRLVTGQSAVDNILREAEEVTGLRMFASNPKLPIPSNSIITEEDAQRVG